MMTRLLQLRKSNDRGIALASAILIMFIVMGLSLILLGLVIMEVKPTLVNAKSTRTISAAQRVLTWR